MDTKPFTSVFAIDQIKFCLMKETSSKNQKEYSQKPICLRTIMWESHNQKLTNDYLHLKYTLICHSFTPKIYCSLRYSQNNKKHSIFSEMIYLFIRFDSWLDRTKLFGDSSC